MWFEKAVEKFSTFEVLEYLRREGTIILPRTLPDGNRNSKACVKFKIR